MPDNPLVRKLQNVVRLDAVEQDRLHALCRDVQTVPARTDIIADGARPQFVHLILKGWAARYKLLPDGSRQIVAFLLPGDFCDLHVTVLAQMDHAIAAITPCDVAYIESDAIERAMQDDPDLTRAIWWATLVDEAVLRSWLVNNGQRNAYDRIAHLLCELHLRMELIGSLTGNRIELPLSQEELADATGMTLVHANRTLKQLRADALIDQRPRALTVLDVEGLRTAADFDPAYLHLRRR